MRWLACVIAFAAMLASGASWADDGDGANVTPGESNFVGDAWDAIQATASDEAEGIGHSSSGTWLHDPVCAYQGDATCAEPALCADGETPTTQGAV